MCNQTPPRARGGWRQSVLGCRESGRRVLRRFFFSVGQRCHQKLPILSLARVVLGETLIRLPPLPAKGSHLSASIDVIRTKSRHETRCNTFVCSKLGRNAY